MSKKIMIKEVIELGLMAILILISYGFGIASVETSARFAANQDKPLKLVFYKEDLKVTIDGNN